MAELQAPFKIFEFSNYHKISHLSNSSLKIGNLTNFIMLFSFLATILYLCLTPIFMIDILTIWSRDCVLQRAYFSLSQMWTLFLPAWTQSSGSFPQ